MQRSNFPVRTVARRGFTLIELLVVITIISILVGLLTYAIFPALTTAKELEVQAELTSLEKALNDFKLQYGVLPPSTFTLYEDDADLASDNAAKSVLRKIWGQTFDFTQDFDWDGDSTPGEPGVSVTLNGAECLAFFLGGMSDGGAPTGFSKNPANPFATGGNRVGPFYEFDTSRFIDRNSNGASEYVDPLNESGTPIYYVHRSDYGSPANALNGSGMTNVYTQGASTFWKSQTFQLIAPGIDGKFGDGGLFNADTADADLAGSREAERDNVTNFHKGRLAPN